jgi:hypothetical protein
MNNQYQETGLIEHALERLRASTAITGRVKEGTAMAPPHVELHISGMALHYSGVVKSKIDRIASVQAFKARTINDEQSLLVTSHMSAEMAARCRELDVQFIDTAGNAYLNNGRGVFVFVSGRREDSAYAALSEQRTSTPASLKVTFALLARPQLLNATFREMAAVSGVSLGLVGQVFAGLQSRGFIGVDGAGKRAFLNRAQLALEWASGYVTRLKPKLQIRRFSVPDAEALQLYSPQPGIATWGGEMAAARLTGHLKPGTFTLYQAPDARSLTGALVSKYKLKADPAGQLEIIDAFWDGRTLGVQEVAPPELVYADLIATLDPRNIETARMIFEKVIANA